MIAVISDSHMPTRAKKIPKEFKEKLEEADLIVHCGDFETEEVYEDIQQHGKVVGVRGNCDRFEIQNSATFERDGIGFGVYHGTGITPRGDHNTLVNMVASELDVGVLLHGHTHQQEAIEKQGTILLNPGSCTGVGGGSASGGTPEMMTLELGQKLQVNLIRKTDGQLETETKEFRV